MDFSKLANNLVNEKICVIKNVGDIQVDDQEKIVKNIQKLISDSEKDFFCTKTVGMNHKNLDNDFLNEGFYSDYFKKRMHVDLPSLGFSDEIRHIISMCMKKFECKRGNGNTYFLDMGKLTNYISDLLNYISDIRISFVHDDQMYRSPIIFMHPYANHSVIFWPTYNVEYLSGDMEVFLEISKIIESYRSDPGNWYEHKWEENDLVIFDNSSMLHAFTPGWKSSERIFNQVTCNTIEPSYFVNGVNIWDNWNFSESN